jgi:hypothetical protein
LEKAGLVPAFLFCDRFFAHFVLRTSVPRDSSAPLCNAFANKRLMACGGHWKSARVLPMFQVHPLAADPVFRDMRA